jgi:hypothetical protein
VEIIEGPVCSRYVMWGSNNQSRFRTWKVRSGDLEGWVQEYSTTIMMTTYALEPIHPPDNSNVEIVSFSADANDGKTVTFTWETRGATHVTLRAAISSEPGVSDLWAVGLPLSGSHIMEMPEIASYYTDGTFYLYASLGAESPAEAWQSIQVPLCAHNFFFGAANDCAVEDEAERVETIYQRFEYGTLVLREDTGWTYALLDDGTWFTPYYGKWEGEDINHDEAPPEGLLLPEGAIGWQWVNIPELREQIGWATHAAQSYTMQHQIGSAPDGGGSVRYLSLPDGDILRLISPDYTWQTVSP